MLLQNLQQEEELNLMWQFPGEKLARMCLEAIALQNGHLLVPLLSCNRNCWVFKNEKYTEIEWILETELK